MKKSYSFLAITLLFVTSAAYAENRVAQAECPATELGESFVQGFAAGAVAGVSVDFLRNKVLPDLTKYNLYGNYNICRDQLTGMAKVIASILGVKFLCDAQCELEEAPVCNKANLIARLLGVVTGACTASYAKKFCPALKKVANA